MDKPGMIELKGPLTHVLDDLLDEIHLKERLTAHELPDDLLFRKSLRMREEIIDRSLRHLKRHTVVLILMLEVAILAGEITVFSKDEGYGFLANFHASTSNSLRSVAATKIINGMVDPRFVSFSSVTGASAQGQRATNKGSILDRAHDMRRQG